MAHIAVTALSHEGLVREHNEDSLVIGPWTLCATVTESPQTLLFPLGSPCLVAVADGLGGHPGGEVASALVVRRLAALGTALPGPDAVREAVLACNQEVFEATERIPELIGMGTTLAGLVIAGPEVTVFNVGDSRVFEFSGGELSQLSTDDSPPPPPGQRTTNIVTQTLGGAISPRTVLPHVTGRPLPADGARYLVCSDGLTDPVPDEEIARILARHDDTEAAVELWRAAIDAGGPDNITLALVSVHPED
ncbi:protein phosphatase 2C domain-containing protein [Kitasatospora sp. NPDC094015]|uniref:PP2C family protein-serine/threonine phosphatase n=1 Tax=Kitasatospora sp. NPDC094015 TaxID=3155205 RepID=UPI00331EC4FF